MTQPVRVNLGGLRALGDEIVGHGAELKRNLMVVESGLVPPGGPGVDGWLTLAATTRASDGWKSYLDALGGRIEAAGNLLTGAAGNYQDSEQRSVQRVGRIRRMPAQGTSGPVALVSQSGATG